VKLLGEILEQAPEVKLLVTSRERLNLRWEWCFAVEGLATPPLTPPLVGEGQEEGFEDYDAVRLFAQTVRRTDRRFALGASHTLAITRICQSVEGMPLAIELAAAAVGTRTCAEIAGEIERGLSFLKTDLRDMPARHRSVQAAFEHSWHLLTPVEQRTFMALSVFRRGCCPQAAIEVTGAAPTVLDSLVSKSLLRWLPVGRYEMHELLRQYASERLAALPEVQTEARNKHWSISHLA
jgi:predicted ATPase